MASSGSLAGIAAGISLVPTISSYSDVCVGALRSGAILVAAIILQRTRSSVSSQSTTGTGVAARKGVRS